MAEHATAESKQKLWDMIKSIQVAMLTTDDGSHLRSRPMVASQRAFDGTLFFLTRASAPKTAEVGARERVNLSYADAHKQNYVSLSGRAHLVRDRATIDDHWSEASRTWFPKGKDDPDLAVLQVEVEEAEYWDAPSSTMLYAYGYAKAVLTGKPPAGGENKKVTL
ncbi:MAG: pyridoxamine 5'-phosphate oxidase family protein [Acetobacteraceae bacterium]|nr:pyridoxamine 5'-phosphate oxidase family protein [Acetobacteraceae bacterium]